MADHIPTRCDHCGQTDTHPKFHYGLATWHHDCAPVDAVDEATAHADWHPHHAAAAAVFKACREDGVKGDALRAHAAKIGVTPEQTEAFHGKLTKLLAGQVFDDHEAMITHIRGNAKKLVV